jgi:peptidyl-prolyl cis-trans isomerase NIMA-interacting 1
MGDWEEKWSKTKDMAYYYNSKTGESKWTKPAEVDDAPTSVRCSHILVKHKDSRRPSSWREEVITRSIEDSETMIASKLFHDQNLY